MPPKVELYYKMTLSLVFRVTNVVDYYQIIRHKKEKR